MRVSWEVTSSFGPWDVDTDSFSMWIQRFGGDPVGSSLIETLAFAGPSHCHCAQPVSAQWVLDLRAADLEDGDYEVVLSALNSQGTYRLGHEYSFTVVEGVSVNIPIYVPPFPDNAKAGPLGSSRLVGDETPSLTPMAGFLALAAIALSRHRRG